MAWSFSGLSRSPLPTWVAVSQHTGRYVDVHLPGRGWVGGWLSFSPDAKAATTRPNPKIGSGNVCVVAAAKENIRWNWGDVGGVIGITADNHTARAPG